MLFSNNMFALKRATDGSSTSYYCDMRNPGVTSSSNIAVSYLYGDYVEANQGAGRCGIFALGSGGNGTSNVTSYTPRTTIITCRP